MSKATPPSLNITAILRDPAGSPAETLERILPVVYDELRRQAHNLLRRERADHTLQTTALIHEAYLRLVDQRDITCNDRSHFFALSATIMRQILVDYARTKHRRKRGGYAEHIPLDEAGQAAAVDRGINLIALDEALERLGELDSQQARIVEMRYFAGMSLDEIARVLDVSESTVSRDWNVARAWLKFELSK
jgi:RNA polymerase sigma factor (TIGR02999 family)